MKFLQHKLALPPVLTLPHHIERNTLHLDSYNLQAGCKHSPKPENGSNRPISYWSRSFSDSQQVHDTIHDDCYAVEWAVLLLLPYLEETGLTRRADRDSPYEYSTYQMPQAYQRDGDIGYPSLTSTLAIRQVSNTKSRMPCQDWTTMTGTATISTMTFPLQTSTLMKTKASQLKSHFLRYVTYVPKKKTSPKQ